MFGLGGIQNLSVPCAGKVVGTLYTDKTSYGTQFVTISDITQTGGRMVEFYIGGDIGKEVAPDTNF